MDASEIYSKRLNAKEVIFPKSFHMKGFTSITHEKLRGIYFTDPEDKEFKETIKNARKKLETSIAPAMPCKIMKKNCGSGASNKIKNKTCVYSGS